MLHSETSSDTRGELVTGVDEDCDVEDDDEDVSIGVSVEFSDFN